MLRFPLESLYPRDRIPSTFAGDITVVEKKAAGAAGTTPAAVSDNGFSTPPPAPSPAASTDTPETSNVAPEESPSVPSEVDALAGLRALIDGGEAPAITMTTPSRDKAESAPPSDDPDDVFLDDHDMPMDADDGQTKASQQKTSPAKAPQAGRSAPKVKQPRIPSPQVLAPVAPHTPPPPGNTTSIPEDAKRLMAWIQEGIGNGSLVYNVPGALVHFIDEGGTPLMLLVSPRIFRHYLESIGEGATGESEDKIGASLQKSFFRAEWHRAGPKKKNILQYRVKRRNSEDGSLLSVVVIPHPERFVNPIPPPNPHIAPFVNPEDDSDPKPIKRIKE
jgi:hypothetical protein